MRKVRVMYKKEGRAVYISHLDIMRTFQRVLTRAGIAVKHTEGFNPHPYISIALPLSLGYSGECEFLDMVITDDMKNAEIVSKMNATLPEGIEVVKVYENGSPVRNIAFSEYVIVLEYDNGVKADCIVAIAKLFSLSEILLMKKSKRGETETNIAPMIKSCKLTSEMNKVYINAVLAAGNTSLNPEYIVRAIEKYLPECTPDFAEFTRKNVLDTNGEEFRWMHSQAFWSDLSAGSGKNAMMRDPEYAAKFLTEFSDRIYYGTDVCSAKQTFRYEFDDFLKKLVSDNMISKDTYEKIIRKNAIKLLKLEKE